MAYRRATTKEILLSILTLKIQLLDSIKIPVEYLTYIYGSFQLSLDESRMAQFKS